MWKISYTIEAQNEVSAPYEKVWEQIVLLEQMKKWNPWLILDTSASTTPVLNDGQVGASYSWSGKNIGSGSMTITQIQKNKIDWSLQFFTPFESSAQASIQLIQKNGQTKIVWCLQSSLPIFLFFIKNKIQSLLTKDFQRGLKMLKYICENGPLETQTIIQPYHQNEPWYYVGLSNVSNQNNIGKHMQEDFQFLNKFTKEKVISIKKYGAIYTKVDEVNELFHFTTFCEIDKKDWERLQDMEEIEKGYYPQGTNIHVTHKGAYHFMDNSWTAGYHSLYQQKLKTNKKYFPYEIYEKLPDQTAEKDLITQIFIPFEK